MISLSHFEYLSLVWGDGGRPFFYVNDDDDVNDDGLPHPCPSPQRGGELKRCCSLLKGAGSLFFFFIAFS